MIELYASGFNAWNQLRFDSNLVEEPYDLWHFEKVVEDEVIEIWRVGFSNTLGMLRITEKPSGIKRILYFPIPDSDLLYIFS